MKRTLTMAATFLSAVLFAGCASTSAPTATSPTAKDLTSSKVTITGQPTRDQFEALENTGTLVINSRTDAERERIDFDQEELLGRINVAYARVPMGGDDGYSPEQVAAFAAVFEAHDGPVLMHCASGGRSRTLYAAYLIEYQGFTPDRAMDAIRTLGQGPSSLERLLGERLSIRRTGQPLPSE